ncbi:MAG: hypothetical protein ABSC07_04655 [Terriglobales bacterium]
MSNSIRVSCIFAVLLAGSITYAQTDFSADIVDSQKAGTPTLAKIYFVKDKRRMEMQSGSGEDTIILKLVQPTAAKRGTHIQAGGAGDAVIMDFAAHTSTILWPKQTGYAQDSLGKLMPAELYGLYPSIQPKDVDNACIEWMRKPSAEGETCRNIGRETVNGRSTVKYELSCYGGICRLWIDRNLRVLVKRETDWNSTELRNVKEGPQLASLFDIPAGYSSRNIAGTIRPTYPQ